MKERSIVLKTEEVKELIKTGKVAIKKLIKDNIYKTPFGDVVCIDNIWYKYVQIDVDSYDLDVIKCFYEINDKFWVKETWCKHTDLRDNVFDKPLIPGIYYKVDNEFDWAKDNEVVKWRSSIHMSREASRFNAMVESIKIEEQNGIYFWVIQLSKYNN